MQAHSVAVAVQVAVRIGVPVAVRFVAPVVGSVVEVAHSDAPVDGSVAVRYVVQALDSVPVAVPSALFAVVERLPEQRARNALCVVAADSGEQGRSVVAQPSGVLPRAVVGHWAQRGAVRVPCAAPVLCVEQVPCAAQGLRCVSCPDCAVERTILTDGWYSGALEALSRGSAGGCAESRLPVSGLQAPSAELAQID